jgi:hypothetical protein
MLHGHRWDCVHRASGYMYMLLDMSTRIQSIKAVLPTLSRDV